MKANAVPLLAIFEKKLRLEVPLFQRQYVWNLENQWEPLWEDISRKFSEYLEGRKDAPVHFLGAMVLDQKQTPTTHVERRQVIDGQQRLTTLQIFLAAFRDFCAAHECPDLASECESFTMNKGMMADPTVDRFKVWPTQLDRAQFSDVMSLGGYDAIQAAHPFVRRKYSRKYEPRPRMVEAYEFFYQQLRGFFVGETTDPVIGAERALSERLEECFQALKSALQVVAIDLDQDDDAQVIFETLNARGEPLLPADLLRNYIFLRAARVNESQEALYNEFWRRFDDPFWRVEARQGRLSRPRSDLYIQHFLASRQTVDIPIKHLFVEYKYWIERKRPFTSIREELATLARQGDDFRRLLEPNRQDPVFDLATFLDAFDVGTAYPLLLHLLDVGLSPEQWQRVTQTLESYLLRRAVCGLTTKNYNRIFLALTRVMRTETTTPERLAAHLATLPGDSTEWPRDSAFQAAWMTKHAYQTLQHPKLLLILRRLDETYRTTKNESISVGGSLSVEHLLPQNWHEHWPLSDGSNGLVGSDLWNAAPDDQRAQATRRRDEALQTIGNLTILTQPLNSSMSNARWEVKKPALLNHSLLPINQSLTQGDRARWDEEAIEQRGADLYRRAIALWPSPADPPAPR